MDIADFLKETDAEVAAIISSKFKIEVVDTDFVPNFGDPSLTYDNVDDQTKRCKRIETCVLYVDIRNSAKISAERQPIPLARMYSAFVRSMIKCARHFGGHVRNIIGDRVMVVFDKKDCFVNAVRTALLCQTVAQKIIDKRIEAFDFKCGVGIDYGKMLVVKAGAIRRGEEIEFYRSLVWMGKPANVASKLTDIANKAQSSSTKGYVHVGRHYESINDWLWFDESYEEFVGKLNPQGRGVLRHEDPYVWSFIHYPPTTSSYTNMPVLATKAVYDGYLAAVGEETVRREGWTPRSMFVSGYVGPVYGSNATFTANP